MVVYVCFSRSLVINSCSCCCFSFSPIVKIPLTATADVKVKVIDGDLAGGWGVRRYSESNFYLLMWR